MSNAISRSEILHGRIFPLMMKLGWPVMLAAVLETVYQLTDTFWLGRLSGSESGNAVAGLQVGFPLIWFFISFAGGFAMSGTALVSQYTGADEKKSANLAAAQVLSTSIISGTVISITGILSLPFLVPLITDISSIATPATDYLTVFFAGMPFFFTFAVFRIIMTAGGDTITPMWVVLFSNIVNMVLDPLLILGFGPIPAMGVKGAALATVISSVISSSIAIYILMKGKAGFYLKPEDLVPRIYWIRKIFKIGLPAAIGHSAEAFGFILLTAIIGRLVNAREALGGYGIGNRIISLAFIAIQGLGQGLSTIIGQSLGAKMMDRAKQAAFRGIGVLFLILSVEMGIIVLFRHQLISIFIPSEPTIIAEGANFLLYFGLSVPMFGIIRGINASFNASGVNVPVMIVSFLRLWAFRLPLAYLFGFFLNYGSTGVWTGMGLSNILTAFAAVLLFFRGSWKRSITEPAES